jgi:Ser/Thr protein kinase RdoA (MazF antagonist)
MPTSDHATLAYQALQPDEILASIESLGYRPDGRLLAQNSYENRVYRIGLEDKAPVVAKFYRPGRWTDEAHRHSDFRFAIYVYRGGRPPELDDLNLLRQIGRLVARIHLTGEIQPFSERPTLDITSYGENSKNYLLENRFIPADLEAAYTSICDHLFDGIRGCYARSGNLGHIRLHADFHPSNVLVDTERVHIVDLDDARMGPAVQDLWMFLSGDRTEQTPQLEQLLEGYTEFRSFDARELHLIEALRTLRIMHYSAWLARRWQDPAFQLAFPWFDSDRYWDDHILALREQAALMEEEPLAWQVSGNQA